jgi:hypothetical protein
MRRGGGFLSEAVLTTFPRRAFWSWRLVTAIWRDYIQGVSAGAIFSTTRVLVGP